MSVSKAYVYQVAKKEEEEGREEKMIPHQLKEDDGGYGKRERQEPDNPTNYKQVRMENIGKTNRGSYLMEATSRSTGWGGPSNVQLVRGRKQALEDPKNYRKEEMEEVGGKSRGSCLIDATSRSTGWGGPSNVKLVRLGWTMSMEGCTPSRSRVSR